MALIELLTAKEQLELYCELRGLTRKEIPPHVDYLLEGMQLKMNKSLVCGRYSGGNKRKLMVAVAMVGEPETLFLDEPSSGMDPYARRHMWIILNNIKRKGVGVNNT